MDSFYSTNKKHLLRLMLGGATELYMMLNIGLNLTAISATNEPITM